MKKTLLLLLLIPSFIFAQSGMVFEHGMTWKEILAKAKTENKYIFMDAFTTWCGPCKMMAANIFPLENVGSFFNKNFINVKVQLDTSKEDNDNVKKWYADAHMIMTDYKVNVFPTYLFLSPDGKLVHRAIGSSPADVFIAKGKDALDPDKQYYVMLDKYKAGNRDPEFMRRVAIAADAAYDKSVAKTISQEYLKTQKDLFTKENIAFIDRFTNSSRDDGFAFIMNNGEKYDAVMGAGAAANKLSGIIKQTELYPILFSRNAVAPDWAALNSQLSTKYPKLAPEIISSTKVIYFQSKQDWNGFQSAVQDYMKVYGAKASPEELNMYAWTVFENCKDMTCVTDALEWSKRSFKDRENPAFMDTYANILYKLGKKEEAIKWEEKALSLVAEGDKKTYTETLDKMKKGEKTWKE
ncbi:MAG: DUF255 domain-containing protein [Chitinophagaceae bacterium]